MAGRKAGFDRTKLAIRLELASKILKEPDEYKVPWSTNCTTALHAAFWASIALFIVFP